MPSHGIPHSKAPDMSQISCLSACNEPVDYQPTQKFRDHTPEFVRIAKAGGHKGWYLFRLNLKFVVKVVIFCIHLGKMQFFFNMKILD